MSIFSISDIIIAATLIINAIALISPKVSDRPNSQSENNKNSEEYEGLLSPRITPSPDGPPPAPQVNERFRLLVSGIRKYSCILGFWNVIFIILMILVFN